MLSDRIGNVTFSEIEALRDNKVPENRTLEYKRELYGKSDDERRELVADVTAFANAAGGDIIFGIAQASDATPEQIVGVAVKSRDEEERRLADTIRTGTEPRLTSFDFKWIEFGEGNSVLILRTARSWRAPHRVTLRGHDRFYVRDSRGKHPMNTEELRSAFLLGETLIERIRSFRRDRIMLIQNDEAPLTLERGPTAILHVVPLVSFADPPLMKFDPHEVTPGPMGSRSGYNSLETLEGKVTHLGGRFSSDPAAAYTLQFRNGINESVLAAFAGDDGGQTKVFIGYLEQCLVEHISVVARYLSRKSIALPFYVMLDLLNVQGTTFATERSHGRALTVQRRHRLTFPEILIAQLDGDSEFAIVLRPLCDLLWNAFGYSRSLNFTEDGQWKPWT